jgi:hypothetical protein
MMVYTTGSHCIYELCPLFSIIETRKHSVLETESISILRLGEGDPYSLEHWLAPSKALNRVVVSLPSLEDRNRSSFQNVVL